MADFLERARPYLPNRIENRTVGEYPAIDRTGELAERLAAITLQPVNHIDPEQWDHYAGGVIQAADQVLRQDVADYSKECAAFGLRARQRLGPTHERSSETSKVMDVFGVHVGGETANKVWQAGYACALGRLDLDPAATLPDTVTRPLEIIQLAHRLFTREPAQWIDLDLDGPLSAEVVLDCIDFTTDQFFTRLYPFFGDEGEKAARGKLRMFALRGFGLGRLQLESEFAERVRGWASGIDADSSTPTPSVEDTALSVDEMVPADVRAALESAGAHLSADSETGAVSIGLNGFALARVDVSPPSVTWTDQRSADSFECCLATSASLASWNRPVVWRPRSCSGVWSCAGA